MRRRGESKRPVCFLLDERLDAAVDDTVMSYPHDYNSKSDFFRQAIKNELQRKGVEV